MNAAKLFVNLNVLSFNDETPALRHRIPRVQTEIHKYLFDLGGVGTYASVVRRERDPDFDMLPNQAMEETRSFGNEIVQVDVSRLQHLTASEGQQLGS